MAEIIPLSSRRPRAPASAGIPAVGPQALSSAQLVLRLVKAMQVDLRLVVAMANGSIKIPALAEED